MANKILRKFRLVAPEYLFVEFHEHFDEVLEKTKLSEEELETVLSFLEEQIETFHSKSSQISMEKLIELPPIQMMSHTLHWH